MQTNTLARTTITLQLSKHFSSRLHLQGYKNYFFPNFFSYLYISAWTDWQHTFRKRLRPWRFGDIWDCVTWWTWDPKVGAGKLRLWSLLPGAFSYCFEECWKSIHMGSHVHKFSNILWTLKILCSSQAEMNTDTHGLWNKYFVDHNLNRKGSLIVYRHNHSFTL